MDDQQPAGPVKHKILLRDHNHPQCFRQFFIIGMILFIFSLRDKHMGQLTGTLQLEQPFKIVCLISLNAKPIHQAQDQLVVITPDFVAAVFLRPEVAGDAKFIRIGKHNSRTVVRHALRNSDMGM